ncbi:uncharacterized protein N7483_012162 [Penicillium malachiteum]|uniref:uncharacterized protein n=1 Tax=Penicillium malachiteum TaxID=1324776 RepID=UPI00254782C1|nr:uncharacterized protein N7483_012162 [Penicillium malachiteum]KAJ5714981.1 hypothetical protein N7483_012162 [Penicillium malachiteum]
MSSRESAHTYEVYPPHHDNPNPRRDSTDPNVVHHLYFEDNDSFFPPTWIGKDEASQRRFPNDSTTSQASKVEHETKPQTRVAQH